MSKPEMDLTTRTDSDDVEQGKALWTSGCHLRWNRISKEVVVTEATTGLMRTSIAVPGKGDDSKKSGPVTKTILNEVSGHASPGEILALMGPSGSGKTSLLNTLSGRSTYNSGILTVDGVEAKGSVMKKLRRKIAYVKQNDIFFGHLTVRDQLTYTALLRLPSTMSKSQKYAEVNIILDMLRLNKCADTAIMLVSGGEKKRVNIGTELLTDPSVIMLDEPTSGLDSTSATALLAILHDLAKKNGKTVVTSIHQPSSSVFRSFDQLLMLADGNVVYFGTSIGSLSYLDNLGYGCPNGYNAADHWMDLLVVDSAAQGNNDGANPFNKQNMIEDGQDLKETEEGGSSPKSRLIEAWDGDAILKNNDEANKNDSSAGSDGTEEEVKEVLDSFGKKYNTSWMTQVLVLMHRSMKNSRSAIFTPLNLTKSGVIGLMMGLLWFQMPYTESTVNDRVSYYFFTMTYWVFDSMFNALMAFPEEREIIFKERASGAYHLSSYFVAKTTSEAPTRLALPCIYMVISYWLAGINPQFTIFLGSTLFSLLSVLSGESMGLLVGATVMNFEKAITVMTVVSLTLMVVGGFFVANVPAFISWTKYLSSFKYAFDASKLMVFDKPVPCDGSGVLPACGSADTGFATPEQVNESLNTQGTIGFNAGMLIVLFIVPRYIAFLALKRHKAGERS